MPIWYDKSIVFFFLQAPLLGFFLGLEVNVLEAVLRPREDHLFHHGVPPGIHAVIDVAETGQKPLKLLKSNSFQLHLHLHIYVHI